MTKYYTPLEAFTGEDACIKECSVFYDIRGADLVPDEISAALALQPTSASRRGDVAYVNKRGMARTHEYGNWCISTKHNDSKSVEKHCREIVDLLTGREPVITSLKESKRYRILSRIVVHTGGPDIAELDILGPTLAALASLCDDVEFDFCGCRRGISYGEPYAVLALDDRPSWAALSDAYGPAESIPAKIRLLEPLPAADTYKSEPYYSLWSALCHQGDVYTASYAAVPHFGRILVDNLGNPHAYNVLALIVAIEANRLGGRGPNLPAALLGAYEETIESLARLAVDIAGTFTSRDHAKIAGAAIAVSNGHGELALRILHLDASNQR